MDDNTYTIRYKIESKLFTEDGKHEFEPIRIHSMHNRVDYSKSFAPMLTVIYQLSHGHIHIIKNNENRMLVSLKVTKLKYMNNEESSTRTEVESDIVFDTIFVPIIETKDISNLREFEDTNDKNESFDEQLVAGYDRSLNIFNVRMYLNTLDYHLMYKKTYNTILRGKNNDNITVDTALRYICETCGAKGYILDTPDNKIPYENIIIPCGNVKYCIDSLQVLYGIYLKDILSFYDFDGKLYILSRLNKSHDYEAGKPRETRLVIASESDNENFYPGVVQYQTNDLIVHTMFKDFEDTSIGIASGEAYGDSIIFTNYGFASETFEYKDGKLHNVNPTAREYLRKALSHNRTGVGLSFEYDELNNNFNLFSTLEAIGVDSVYIVKTENMDLDCLKPNTVFSIHVSGPNESDNDRFIDRKFPILQFNQEFIRDNLDGETNNVFKTSETISLANIKE